jgi:hypothetical protein
MRLHPEDLRYWSGWLILGVAFLGALYFVIKWAVLAALRAPRV